MNFKQVGNADLLEKTSSLVKEECRITLEVLHCLREIERRRLYAERGYGSLMEFTIKYLGYSEGAAYRRIGAMRLIKDVPEVEGKILDGKMSLTVAAQVQTFIRKQKISEKSELVARVESKSSREVERTLLGLAPESLPKEKMRAVTKALSELRVLLDLETRGMLDQLLELLSHKNSSMSYAELLRYLAKLGLEKHDPLKQRSRAATSAPKSSGRRYISASLRRKVWSRDGGSCSYRDPVTGRKCESKYRLEVDHVRPVALGGLSDEGNLRILCREHNALAAIHKLGAAKMRPYLASD